MNADCIRCGQENDCSSWDPVCAHCRFPGRCDGISLAVVALILSIGLTVFMLWN